jgi:orotate phosphoribosyltransferase
MDAGAVLAELRECGALLEGHFALSSGLHSDRYFQCALVLQHPERAERLARALAARLRERGLVEGVEAVIGPALGAVTWAYEVARALGVRGLFAERQDGALRLRRGFALRPGERVLVVEDVLTTGGSAREVLALVAGLGARPVAVAALVDRSGGDAFAAEGLACVALAEVKVETWRPESCPRCAAGEAAVKPGSRPGAAGVGERAR